MITKLHIRNFVLIDQTTIYFGKGLNILSGETGSGKSAILSALSLIVGQRSDANLVRDGFDKALIEAVFEVDSSSSIAKLLQDSGIDYDLEDSLIIYREIASNGKGRILINHQNVSLTFLKKVGELLISIIGQHATQKLNSLEYHRYVLDAYGGIQELVYQYKSAFEEEKKLKEKIEYLKNCELERERDLQRYLAEEEEILAANIGDGEDDTLFEEYSRLLHIEEFADYFFEIEQAFESAIFPGLSTVKRKLDRMKSLNSEYEQVMGHFHSLQSEFQELVFILEKLKNQYDLDPSRKEFVNERLSEITKLKKKYGNPNEYANQLKEKIDRLENVEKEIEELEIALERKGKVNENFALEISKKRKQTALDVEEKILGHIRQLNMPQAKFFVVLSPSPCSNFGNETVEFFFAPNKGEKVVSVRESASGGELSRVMLAIQTLLAEKVTMPTLLFDEIDANIGGETASVVGDQLKFIAKNHQILCVTHFPQVAKRADHHFCIRKEESQGRTITLVDSLSESDRVTELNRMLGFCHAF